MQVSYLPTKLFVRVFLSLDDMHLSPESMQKKNIQIWNSTKNLE